MMNVEVILSSGVEALHDLAGWCASAAAAGAYEVIQPFGSLAERHHIFPP